MRMLTDRIGPTILLLGFCISSPHLFGAVITSGSINLPSGGGGGTFTLSGTGFAVAGNFNGAYYGVWPVYTSCQPCNPGSSLPVDGYVLGTDLRGGTATIGATVYPSVIWGDLFAAQGSFFRTTGPTITLDHGPGTYTGSFSFTGSLCGTTTGGPQPHPCTIDLLGLTGSGQVSVTILPIQDAGNLLHSGAATYTFTSVPEPSSIVLVGTAALILLGRRRRLNMARVRCGNTSFGSGSRCLRAGLSLYCP
jgi:hypothetical protein